MLRVEDVTMVVDEYDFAGVYEGDTLIFENEKMIVESFLLEEFGVKIITTPFLWDDGFPPSLKELEAPQDYE